MWSDLTTNVSLNSSDTWVHSGDSEALPGRREGGEGESFHDGGQFSRHCPLGGHVPVETLHPSKSLNHIKINIWLICVLENRNVCTESSCWRTNWRPCRVWSAKWSWPLTRRGRRWSRRTDCSLKLSCSKTSCSPAPRYKILPKLNQICRNNG